MSLCAYSEKGTISLGEILKEIGISEDELIDIATQPMEVNDRQQRFIESLDEKEQQEFVLKVINSGMVRAFEELEDYIETYPERLEKANRITEKLNEYGIPHAPAKEMVKLSGERFNRFYKTFLSNEMITDYINGEKQVPFGHKEIDYTNLEQFKKPPEKKEYSYCSKCR